MNVIKLIIPQDATNDEIREIARNQPFNGEYTYKICKHCGAYKSSLEGNWKTSEIIDKCELCFG